MMETKVRKGDHSMPSIKVTEREQGIKGIFRWHICIIFWVFRRICG